MTEYSISFLLTKTDKVKKIKIIHTLRNKIITNEINVKLEAIISNI